MKKQVKPQQLFLTKRGTITAGDPRVTDIIPAEGYSEKQLLSLAYSLEKRSEHPLAKAVTVKAEEEGTAFSKVTEFEALAGNGLRAKQRAIHSFSAEALNLYLHNLRSQMT